MMLLQVVLGVVVLLVMITLMSVGVLFGRQPIKGSCGGMGAALGETNYECDFCGGDPDKCDSRDDEDVANPGLSLAYEAARAHDSRSGQ